MTDVGLEALDLMTVAAVAKRLQFSEKTVRRLINREKKQPGTGLFAVREGRAIRIPAESVAAYLERLTAEAQSSAA